MSQPHPHRAGTHDWIVFLVTGPTDSLAAFWGSAPVEFFDQRGQTIRCRAHAIGDDRGQANYERAVEAAKAADVTLQDLVNTGGTRNAQTHLLGGGAHVTVSDCVEEYPVVHLGSHGLKWPPPKP